MFYHLPCYNFELLLILFNKSWDTTYVAGKLCSGMYCISNSVPGVFVPRLVYAAALFYIIYGTWVFAPGGFYFTGAHATQCSEGWLLVLWSSSCSSGWRKLF